MNKAYSQMKIELDGVVVSPKPTSSLAISVWYTPDKKQILVHETAETQDVIDGSGLLDIALSEIESGEVHQVQKSNLETEQCGVAVFFYPLISRLTLQLVNLELEGAVDLMNFAIQVIKSKGYKNVHSAR
jgi:hypothetical protein